MNKHEKAINVVCHFMVDTKHSFDMNDTMVMFLAVWDSLLIKYNYEKVSEIFIERINHQAITRKKIEKEYYDLIADKGKYSDIPEDEQDSELDPFQEAETDHRREILRSLKYA